MFSLFSSFILRARQAWRDLSAPTPPELVRHLNRAQSHQHLEELQRQWYRDHARSF
jgi:hypothetical protein